MGEEVGDLGQLLTDELFTVEPDRFTGTRDSLVKRLRAEKRRDEAALVAKLKRPTATIWAINTVARANTARIVELRSIGAEALLAQDQLLSGGPVTAVHAAAERRRQVVSELVNATTAVLAEKGSRQDRW